ncbi:MAG: ATP-binding protein [Planctomycetota bacterium]
MSIEHCSVDERPRFYSQNPDVTALLVHEIRNLVTPLASLGQRALQRPDDHALAQRVIELAVRSASDASNMATWAAGAEAGEQRTNTVDRFRLESLQTIVSDLVDLISVDTSEMTRLSVDHSNDLAIVPGSPVRHALLNVLRNSIKALACQPSDARFLRLTSRVQPSESSSTWNTHVVLVEIEDSGSGFDTSQQEFNGLGLRIVQQMLDRMGGTLELGHGQRWGGALVGITIPCIFQTNYDHQHTTGDLLDVGDAAA